KYNRIYIRFLPLYIHFLHLLPAHNASQSTTLRSVPFQSRVQVSPVCRGHLSICVYYGPYNALLNHLFPVSEG
ncbi:hypothetical protein L211DRAFT_822648, partial [Terfezia boudieri ATCC MYA-4762]